METTCDQLISPERTAEMLGVTCGTLSVWRCNKRYALSYVKVGARVRYRRADVEKWLAERTVTPAA